MEPMMRGGLDLSQGITIGDPVLAEWGFTIHITCPCGLKFLWMGQPGFEKPGTLMTCRCGKTYTFVGMPTFNENGEIKLNLLHSTPRKP